MKPEAPSQAPFVPKARKKVAVYTIALNEEKFTKSFMDCLKDEADAVYVADTGSTDRTVEALRDYGATVEVINVKPWRFDVPRNVSLAMVPRDVDICVCIDLDEVLTAGWRDCIESAWTPTTTRLRYKYAWSHLPDGSPGTTFWYDKVHQRKNYRWVKPVHEVLNIYNQPEVQTFCEGFMLHHWPDPTKSRSSYLPLLELSCKEEPEDDRNSHYLGREYMFHGMYEKSIAELERHLKLPRARWEAERAASMMFIARCLGKLGKHAQAVRWAHRAHAESPEERDPLVELAQLAYEARDFTTCYFASKKAVAITERPAHYICYPEAWGYRAWDFLAISAWNLGHKAEGLAAAKKALELEPNDTRLQNNVKFMAQV